jgi:hypothetical protein
VERGYQEGLRRYQQWLKIGFDYSVQQAAETGVCSGKKQYFVPIKLLLNKIIKKLSFCFLHSSC